MRPRDLVSTIDLPAAAEHTLRNRVATADVPVAMESTRELTSRNRVATADVPVAMESTRELTSRNRVDTADLLAPEPVNAASEELIDHDTGSASHRPDSSFAIDRPTHGLDGEADSRSGRVVDPPQDHSLTAASRSSGTVTAPIDLSSYVQANMDVPIYAVGPRSRVHHRFVCVGVCVSVCQVHALSLCIHCIERSKTYSLT